ncbi:MAG: hypothetical protein WBY47_18870 [Desulfobacterales bacterium]|jgi:magnesium-transporting ATPase (P-type)
MTEENTSETKDSKIRGLATLFNKAELKRFFKAYIFFIFILEVLIFLFCFLCQLEPINIPFPWETYYVAAFVIPIGVTFLLGVFVTAFNIYIFGDSLRGGKADSEISENEGETNAHAKYMGKFKSSLNIMRQIPFLAGLLFLMVGAIIFPKVNVFFEFLGRAGSTVISHTKMGLLILLGIGTFFGLVWLFMKYRLQKLSMQYQYKQDIANRLGLIITDDNRLINTEGRVINFDDSKNIAPPIEANPSKALMLSKRKS